MSIWMILLNGFLTLIILGLTIINIIDYRKHKDEERIAPEDLKELRRNHFKMTMLICAWLLLEHVERFFN